MSKYYKDPDVIAALSPEEYHVTQNAGTERPGTGPLLENKEPGLYVDIVSGEPLFASSDKYESDAAGPALPNLLNQLLCRNCRIKHWAWSAPKCDQPMATATLGMYFLTDRPIAVA